ncbi:MAG: porin [Planctomycetota bacterium]|nr:porin [Planctomycetota bacterium]
MVSRFIRFTLVSLLAFAAISGTRAVRAQTLPAQDGTPASSATDKQAKTPDDGFTSEELIEDGLAGSDQQPSPRPRSVRDWCAITESAFHLRGRVDSDAIWAGQSPANTATFGDLPDVVGLRRARIGVEGKLGTDSRYIAEIDLASGQVVLRDLFAGWGDLQGSGEFRVGHLREPFSLEGGTSANTFAFLERSPINDLDPARNWGLGYFRCTPAEDSTFAIGVFQSGTDSSDLQGGDGSDTAVTGRWTGLLRYEDEGERLLHVGLALSARLPDRGVVVINQQPSSPLLDLGDSSASPFMPRIRIPADFQQLGNLQLALINGSYWMQAEWYGSLIDQRGGDPIFFQGSHVDAGYFLTGEKRSYQKRNGVFGPVTVERPLLRCFSTPQSCKPLGYGALELTARFSYLDYSDPHTPIGPQGQSVGILLPQATFGVNWYLADRLRVMFNYSYDQPNEPNTGASSASVFAMRLGTFW